MSYTDHGRRHGPSGTDAPPPGGWQYAEPVAPADEPADYVSGAEGNAPFQNGAANVALPDSSYSPLRWRFVTKGRVEIVGAVDGMAIGDAIVTLPAVFWPETDVAAAISSVDGSRVMAVSISASTGEVIVLQPPTSGPVTTDQLEDSGATAGTYGDANHVGQFTVDAKGRVTSAVAVAITYRPGGTDVALADGGTGTSLSDPNADRIMFWDDSAGSVDWLSPGTNLSISGTTLNATGGSGSVATDAIFDAKGDLPVGTGADTASKQTVGSNDTVLTADSGQTTGVKWVKVGEGMIALTDVTTANVSSSAHGFAPKSPADATKFLNGAATPAYAQVLDSDLSTSDITTNNSSTSKHGFLKKLDNDSTHYMDGTGAWSTPGSASVGLADFEVDYAEITSDATISSTSSGSPNDVIVGAAISLNGSTSVKVEFYTGYVEAASGVAVIFKLYDGSTDLGIIGYVGATAGGTNGDAYYLVTYLRGSRIPGSGSHTYKIKAYRTGSSNAKVHAGAAGAGTIVPAWMAVSEL